MRLAKLMGLTAALMLGLVALPDTASAGGKFGHFGFSGHFGGHGGHSYQPRHRAHVGIGSHGGHRFGHRRSFRHGNHRFRGHHPRRSRHGGHGAGRVLLGVGAGLLIYHAIDRASDRRSPYTTGNRVTRKATPPRTAPRPVYNERRGYRSGTGPYYRRSGDGLRPHRGSPEAQADASSGQSCLQTREYSTKVTIDGREVDAYGTACLQPDGSWVMGPLQQTSAAN